MGSPFVSVAVPGIREDASMELMGCSHLSIFADDSSSYMTYLHIAWLHTYSRSGIT